MPMRLKVSEDVIPITDLRQNSAKILARLRKSRRPIVIAQRGRPAAILESVEEYEKKLDRLELSEAILRGLEDVRQGRVIPNSEVMRRLKEVAVG